MENYLLLFEPWKKALGIFILFVVIRLIYKNIAIRLLRHITQSVSFKLGEDILNAFEKPINLLLWVLNFYCAFKAAPLWEGRIFAFADHLLRSVIIFSFFWGVYNISGATHAFMGKIFQKLGIEAEPTIENFVSSITRGFIMLIGFVAIIKEWNYDITGVLASLSIGSLAAALAAKDALANVFGSLVIILEKPFKVGDWISANGVEGTVEKISFRSTCIRTFPQELVYLPNNLLSNAPIINYTKRERYRVDFTLGFTYSSTKEQMQQGIEGIRNYLVQHPLVFSKTIEVLFSQFNDSSLDVRVICYVKTKNAAEYRKFLNQMNLDLLEVIQKAGLSCAFPSRSLYLENPVKFTQEK